jgi:hypothetical protein
VTKRLCWGAFAPLSTPLKGFLAVNAKESENVENPGSGSLGRFC